MGLGVMGPMGPMGRRNGTDEYSALANLQPSC